jgi:hypothetical protein
MQKNLFKNPCFDKLMKSNYTYEVLSEIEYCFKELEGLSEKYFHQRACFISEQSKGGKLEEIVLPHRKSNSRPKIDLLVILNNSDSISAAMWIELGIYIDN